MNICHQNGGREGYWETGGTSNDRAQTSEYVVAILRNCFKKLYLRGYK